LSTLVFVQVILEYDQVQYRAVLLLHGNDVCVRSLPFILVADQRRGLPLVELVIETLQLLKFGCGSPHHRQLVNLLLALLQFERDFGTHHIRLEPICLHVSGSYAAGVIEYVAETGVNVHVRPAELLFPGFGLNGYAVAVQIVADGDRVDEHVFLVPTSVFGVQGPEEYTRFVGYRMHHLFSVGGLQSLVGSHCENFSAVRVVECLDAIHGPEFACLFAVARLVHQTVRPPLFSHKGAPEVHVLPCDHGILQFVDTLPVEAQEGLAIALKPHSNGAHTRRHLSVVLGLLPLGGSIVPHWTFVVTPIALLI